MNILCVDLEATCWERNQTPDNMYPEIIEIGLAMVFQHDDGKLFASRLDNSRLFVKPRVSTISEFCYNLTGITPEMVYSGKEFKEAVEKIRHQEFKLWCSWGHWDLDMFRTQCDRHNVGNPLRPVSYINLKTLHWLMTGHKHGLGKAMNFAGLGFHGDQHRGSDDAYNVARLLKYYMSGWGLDKSS